MKGLIIFSILVLGVYFGSQYLGINPFAKQIRIDLNSPLTLSESNVNSKFSDLGLECAAESGNLGDRVCWADISGFNGMPANMIAFFFKNDDVSYLRVASNRDDHNELKNYIDREFKYTGVSPNSVKDVGQELGVWLSKSGRVTFTIDSPPRGEETTLLWKKTI